MTEPWNEEVRGVQAQPLINKDAPLIRVEAGPGTGKTFGLVRRVERIVHPKGLAADGRKVLIVAFNRVIAKQLKTEISQRLDPLLPSTNFPVIRTIHSLCVSMLDGHLRLLLPHETEAMVYDVLYRVPELQNIYPTFDGAMQALRNHEADHEEHIELWQACQQWLTRHQAHLISDVPRLILDRLKGGDYPDTKYEHIIVDEFQDLTPGEQRLMFRLLSFGGQLIALGDPRQSIYKFRGNDADGLAKLASVAQIEGRDSTIYDIRMNECHRCPPQIVVAANFLMSLSPAKTMYSAGATVANIHVVTWKDAHGEARGMAKHIVKNLAEHGDERHLAMVTRRQFGYRLRDQIHALDPALSVDLSFSEGLLETWPVRESFLFFCLIVDPDPPTWRAWLGYQNSCTGKSYKAPKRNSGAYLKLLEAAGNSLTHGTISSLASEQRENRRGAGGTIIWDRSNRYIRLYDGLSDSGHDDPEGFLDRMFDVSKWTSSEHSDETAVVDMELLLQKAQDILLEEDIALPGTERLRGVARRLRYQIATREPLSSGETVDLQIATMWGAKGTTAEHVYLLGACDEAIPGARREDYPGSDEDYVEEQRRLFYVSITRSKRTLVISRHLSAKIGEAKQLGLAIDESQRYHCNLFMSRFMRDISRQLPNSVQGHSWAGC